MKIELDDTNVNDLETLFKFQIDAEANHLAAFTQKNPGDKDAYIKNIQNYCSTKP